MSWQKKLDEWHKAGILPASTAQAIRNYEETQPRLTDAIWRYGLFGLAALCIGLGLWFIIAANWQSIPFSVKLGGHTLLNLAFGAATIYFYRTRHDIVPAVEIPLLLTAAGQLSIMALIGQHLHISSPMEDVMLHWWLLIVPMLLLVGRTFFSGALVLGLTIFVAVTKLDLDFRAYFIPIFTLAPALYILSHAPKFKSLKPGWIVITRLIGLYTPLFFAVLILIEPSAFAGRRNAASEIIYNNLFGGVLIAAALFYLWREKSTALNLQHHAHHVLAIILATATAGLGQILIFAKNDHTTMAIVFCAFFLALGRIAYHHQRRWMLSAAILFVAGRMIVYFSQMSNNMLVTGVAMIAIGLGAIYLMRKLLPHMKAHA
jgi:uncharacterized membrane protein